MSKEIAQRNRKARRALRVRTRMSGTADCPRLSVFRSLRGLSLQLIDDAAGRTLVSVNSKKDIGAAGITDAGERSGATAAAYVLGKALAAKAIEKKIGSAVFDRGSYKYHGRVKAAADGARDGGLVF